MVTVVNQKINIEKMMEKYKQVVLNYSSSTQETEVRGP